MKSPHSVRRRPPTEFSGFESSFRMWVFGFAMETSSLLPEASTVRLSLALDGSASLAETSWFT